METKKLPNNDNIIKPKPSNFFLTYLNDIKNLQTLNEEMINNIYYMTTEEKMSIIIVLNDIVNNFKFILD